MDQTVDRLEAMFQKAETDLDLVHRKLDNECAAQCNGVNMTKDNKVKLLEQISEIKDEYKKIVDDAKEIQKAQTDAMMYFRDTISQACVGLMQLQTSSSLPSEKPEELTKVEELLGLNIPDTVASSPSPVASNAQDIATPAVLLPTPAKSKQPEAATSRVQPQQREISAYDRRKGATEFIEVIPAEFETVSTLIRGRVKLPDVNITYHILWEHFQDSEEMIPLSPSDMFKMGLNVTGKTGDAKLKVLRALKLLSISKKGEVLLLM